MDHPTVFLATLNQAAPCQGQVKWAARKGAAQGAGPVLASSKQLKRLKIPNHKYQGVGLQVSEEKG